jgi:hypothetical protein
MFRGKNKHTKFDISAGIRLRALFQEAMSSQERSSLAATAEVLAPFEKTSWVRLGRLGNDFPLRPRHTLGLNTTPIYPSGMRKDIKTLGRWDFHHSSRTHPKEVLLYPVKVYSIIIHLNGVVALPSGTHTPLCSDSSDSKPWTVFKLVYILHKSHVNKTTFFTKQHKSWKLLGLSLNSNEQRI